MYYLDNICYLKIKGFKMLNNAAIQLKKYTVSNETLLDIFIFYVLIPLFLSIVFLTPLNNSFALYTAHPTLCTIYFSNFAHAGISHFVNNLIFYLIIITLILVLHKVMEIRTRKEFYSDIVLIYLIVPLIVSLYNIMKYPGNNTTAFLGFSGIDSALNGYLVALVFVPPHLADELSHLFDSLNPYDFDLPILEIEDGMEDIWFYGISSKRYCLFHKIGNKITIPEGKKLFYKLHGLGHITNPFSRELKEGDQWHKRLWDDILNVHFHPESLSDVLEKYENYAVISNLAVSTGTILRRFKKMNEGKPFDKKIKPFNFMLVGNGTTVNEDGEKVKPVSPFNKNPQVAIEQEFIDYNTGDTLQGREYWKPLSDVFLDYIDHPEAKFEGNVGVLERRHLKPSGCVYIGKEANKVEMQELESNTIETYQDIEKIREFVLGLTPAEAREIGIKYRSTLKKIKDNIKLGKKLNFKTKEMKKILQCLARMHV
jgi:membrane associated rhomboid family serine protease